MVYVVSLILIVSWLSLITYAVFFEPELLERWKYPNLSFIGLLIIITLPSVIITGEMMLLLAILGINLKNYFLALWIMFFSNIIGLHIVKEGKYRSKVSYNGTMIPAKTGDYLLATPRMIFTFLCVLITIIFVFDALETGVSIPGLTDQQEGWRDWLGVTFFLFLTISMFYIFFKPRVLKRFDERLKEKWKEIKQKIR